MPLLQPTCGCEAPTLSLPLICPPDCRRQHRHAQRGRPLQHRQRASGRVWYAELPFEHWRPATPPGRLTPHSSAPLACVRQLLRARCLSRRRPHQLPCTCCLQPLPAHCSSLRPAAPVQAPLCRSSPASTAPPLRTLSTGRSRAARAGGTASLWRRCALLKCALLRCSWHCICCAAHVTASAVLLVSPLLLRLSLHCTGQACGRQLTSGPTCLDCTWGLHWATHSPTVPRTNLQPPASPQATARHAQQRHTARLPVCPHMLANALTLGTSSHIPTGHFLRHVDQRRSGRRCRL